MHGAGMNGRENEVTKDETGNIGYMGEMLGSYELKED